MDNVADCVIATNIAVVTIATITQLIKCVAYIRTINILNFYCYMTRDITTANCNTITIIVLLLHPAALASYCFITKNFYITYHDSSYSLYEYIRITI